MDLLVILGPTASGKTQLAVQAAQHFDAEIISADSRQVYRGLDLGSGKDLNEYGSVPYHLIDVVDPGDPFSLFDFLQSFKAAYRAIRDRGRLPILAGGTGLYLDAVLRGYTLVKADHNPELRDQLANLDMTTLQQKLCQLQPNQHNTTDLQDRQRLIRAIEIATAARSAGADRTLELPDLSSRVYGLRWPRDVLRRRITQRLRARLEQGMIEEVERLHAAGVSWDTLDEYGLEYRFVARYLQGQLNRNDLFQKLNSAIHQFAKRQDTWFRRMERQGVAIHWLEGPDQPLAALLQSCREEA
ncbi:MAG: tRNA (adenosine(37)-N6)-dimethylallyltransferase MiaA [Desulfuromonadales bacterium]|jgi:tRNA dimethylallyltransferase